MIPSEIIAKKRDGYKLEKEEIEFMIEGFTNGSIPEYQISAWAMAIYFNGMTYEETAMLTSAMLHSGEVLNLHQIPGTKVDKHSTGGVGDKVSLPLVAIVAACGVPIPMMSGRGLGHTGGTLDKLEAIPGFNVHLNLQEFIEAIKKTNCGMIGQTKEVAPADKKFYALRDVTGTVASLPLITASIMSKKLAEGAEAFSLDVKFGHGAFMQKKDDALKLAEFLVKTAELNERPTVAYLTNMDQPLGLKIGNWLEVEESIDILKGKGPKDMQLITHLFAASMILQGGKANDLDEAFVMSKEAVKSGKAFDKFVEITEHQNGDSSFLHNPEKYPKAKEIIDIKADKSGFVHMINSLELGLTGVLIGAGRKVITDNVDHIVGIEIFHKVGEKVNKGDVIAKLHLNQLELKEAASDKIKAAFTIDPSNAAPIKLIDCIVTKDGTQELPESILKMVKEFS